MKEGNWIPVDKRIIRLLDHSKPFTKIEAYISLRIDLDNNQIKGLREYGRIWQWSKTKVSDFFQDIGYESGDKKRTKKRQEKDRKRTPYRIVLNNLNQSKSSESGQKKDKKRTKKRHNYNPNPKPNNNEEKDSSIYNMNEVKYL